MPSARLPLARRYDHRAQNRRIEIQLQPNLSELPSMGDLAKQSG
jgi:hypothetical protein